MIARCIIALAALVCLPTVPAQADAVADFYKDKTITLVSAGEAGGAHGTYAQLLVQHFRRARARQSQYRHPAHGGRRRQSRA